MTERRMTRSSGKPAATPMTATPTTAAPTTAAEIVADGSDPFDTVAGPSAEPATPAVITDDR